MDHGSLLIIGASIIGFLMAWGVGANDLANVMSTTMGSKAITVRQAMIIAVIFEFAGALLGGIHVTNTICNGIIDPTLLQQQGHILVLGMLSTLIAGMIWMLFASAIAMPVSITNAIIGALVGFGTIVLGFSAIHWKTVSAIAISWIFSPIIAGIVAYWIFNIIKLSILSAENPARKAKQYMPFYFFVVGIILTIMIVLKDLSTYGYHLNLEQRLLLTITTSLILTVLGAWLTNKVRFPSNAKRPEKFEYVEKLFSILMIFTACAMVFAHGSNDVAISVGPIAAILNIVKAHGNGLGSLSSFPIWVLIMGCVGVVFGLLMYGHKVIATVGEGITMLTPSRAFAATIAAAGTVIVSTSGGIPVSATQTLVGGVLGVGLARGIGALNLNIIRNIFLSWFVTIPATALLTIIFFRILQLFL